MNKKITAILLMVIGIVLLVTPKLTEMYQDYQQEQLLKEWQASLLNIDSAEEPAEQGQEGAVKPTSTLPATRGSEDNTTVKSPEHEAAEGILTIDKINLKLPILHGATQENMKKTVASIASTGKAGEVGNYAIAGHRNRTYGRNFNRLDELAEGDHIKVNNGKEQFEYTVTEKLRVKPDEVWVLKPDGKDKEITLVTCDPMINPTHRLIIKGKIID
ncbi:class D sortase [Paenibacillus terrigena]|uniref:class D sortase n=1 Tax=Paenibacillus terrigena TaxID=369333 RepID=UPI0028D31178|nr:class D sortase [Paenibacillus terrigena]